MKSTFFAQLDQSVGETIYSLCRSTFATTGIGSFHNKSSLKPQKPGESRKYMRVLVGLLVAVSVVFQARPAPFTFVARARQLSGSDQPPSIVYQEKTWEGTNTVVIVCDMWDAHWCKGATARVKEMAPRMNEFLQKARALGMLIVHAPSGTMKHYEGYPQRRRAQEARRSSSGTDLNRWRPLDKAREGMLPIDDSDGGCDDTPQCAQASPWQCQIETIQIALEDAISDSGEEIMGLLCERGIENVILLGVHANMCVLGRPFGIRAMVGAGKNVLLVRDLTDTMYNSRKHPFVSHFAGTDLVIEHIERNWCPTITSADMLGGKEFRFANDNRPIVAMIIGESEYHTWETLPAFASDELLKAGLRTEYVVASPSADDYQFKNFRILGDANLILVSARRRAMPPEMASLLKKHIELGKPVVGIRTASHAFALRGTVGSTRAAAGFEQWPEFDAEVLGGNYSGHHGADRLTTVRVVPEALGHPVLKGVESNSWTSSASLYKTSPLKPGTQVLLTGEISGEPSEPVAWVNFAGTRRSRVFYTSLGHPSDFSNTAFRRLLKNGILWALGMDTQGN